MKKCVNDIHIILRALSRSEVRGLLPLKENGMVSGGHSLNLLLYLTGETQAYFTKDLEKCS